MTDAQMDEMRLMLTRIIGLTDLLVEKKQAHAEAVLRTNEHLARLIELEEKRSHSVDRRPNMAS